MPVIDTSWLLRIFDESDPRHGEAREQLGQARQIVVTPTVVAEAIYVMMGWHARRMSRSQAQVTARESMAAFVATPTVRVEESSRLDAAFELMEVHPRISFPDAAVAVTAKSLGQDLWTYDQDQRAAFESLSG